MRHRTTNPKSADAGITIQDLEMQTQKQPIPEANISTTDSIPAGDAETEDNGRTRSVKGLIADAASNTGTHGVPNIMRHNSKFRRIFWMTIVLCGLGAYGSCSLIVN